MREPKSFSRKPLAVAAIVVIGGIAQVSAYAQTAPIGAPTPRQERPDNRSATARAAEDYSPKGVPMGSFRLFPELELDEVYNDNIYANSPAVGKVGSFIQVIKPSVNLRSDWTQHMLNFGATGAFGLYTVDSLSNYQDFGVNTDGRYDIARDWNVYGGASFNRRHEDRGSPASVQTAGTPPNIYHQLAGNVGYFQTFNRFSYRADARADNYTYQNPGAGASVGSMSNYDRNRTELREALRLNYEFSPGYQVYTRGSLNQRQYVNTVDVLGFYHNSTGFDVVAGLAVDLGGITSIEVFGGYLQQNYVDGRYSQVSGPMFGLTGYWQPLKELLVKPFVRRTIEESSIASTLAYLSTSTGVDVQYDVRPNIQLNGHFDYSIADYNAAAGSGPSRYDQYVTFRADAKYSLTSNFYIGPQYQYISRTSNTVNGGYDQNIVMLRLGAQL